MRLLKTLPALALAAGAVLAPTAAHAVGPDSPIDTWQQGTIHYGHGDPIANGCNDARTVATASDSYGTLELRWSDRCSSNWARYTSKGSAYTYVRTDVATPDRVYWAAEGYRWNSFQYSNMIRIPSTRYACATVNVVQGTTPKSYLEACA